MNQPQQDLTILGGGLAGLSLALQVRQECPHAKILVLEKRSHPAPEAAHKVGESTVEAAAHYFGRILGLQEHIQAGQLPKLGLRFFFPAGDNQRIEDRLELGGKRFAPCPSYQLDRGRFENFLAERCLSQQIQFVDQADVENIALGRHRSGHEVSYCRAGATEVATSRWVVDASGRRAFLKRKLGLEKPSPHIGNAAWFRFKRHVKIDQWSSDPVWRAGHEGNTERWYSTNHLMGQGYWVWLIPLASGSTSMGIVAAEEFHALSEINSMEKAVAWLERFEPQCAAVVREHLDDLQDFRAIKHYAVECKQVFSARRWGITGEAGFFHDPFYSPGSDFIAFANTFLTDLIRRDLASKDFRIRAFTYDRIYKRFYYGTCTAYQDQYRLFGNATVMPVKILWDYLIYWSITAFIFMQGRMCHPSMYLRNLSQLSRLAKLNHFMQDFFRQWHERTCDQAVGRCVNISEMPIIREMNSRLLEELSSPEFYRQFRKNVAQLEHLAGEIVAHSGLNAAPPLRPNPQASLRSDAFRSVLSPAPRQAPPELLQATG